MKKINWEIFFGDSSSEEAVCLFASRLLTFKQFAEYCSYSDNRLAAIKVLKHRGYNKSINAAQKVLRNRGFKDYINSFSMFSLRK